MNEDYIEEGYKLITEYITEKRIKTKNRKFLRRLDKFYNNYKVKETSLTAEDMREYLQLEKEFYNNILQEAPETKEDKASLEVLNVLANTHGKSH